MPSEFQLRDKSNFTNPMYDAMGNLENQADLAAADPQEVRRAMSYEPKPLTNVAGKNRREKLKLKR
jgi:hypothetical protein